MSNRLRGNTSFRPAVPCGGAARLAESCETGAPSLDAFPEAEILLKANLGAASAVTQAQGLTPVDYGLIVYDANQGVCWLADANLASDPVIREQLAVGDVTADGAISIPLIEGIEEIPFRTTFIADRV